MGRVLTVLLAAAAAPPVSALVLSPGFETALRAGGVHREEGFAPSRLVDDLRVDVLALEALQRFEPAGSGPRGGASNGMRSATFADPIGRPRAVGCWDAFAATWERLDLVRCELMEGLDRELLEQVEVHYVRYPEGGFFQRHVDDFVDGDAAHRRSVSFILYLNEPELAWRESDGGALRVHPSGIEYLPDAGSLLLFDSMQVQHEVLPTRRERTCLVGWFHAPCES